MAKRTRGGTRPGQRPATRRTTAQRVTTRPAPIATPSSAPATALTDAEEARAAELEAQILAQERAAEVARRKPKGGRRAEVERGPRGESSLLAARAAEEYAYVRRDLTRIGRIGGGLTAVIAVLWVLDLTNVF